MDWSTIGSDSVKRVLSTLRPSLQASVMFVMLSARDCGVLKHKQLCFSQGITGVSQASVEDCVPLVIELYSLSGPTAKADSELIIRDAVLDDVREGANRAFKAAKAATKAAKAAKSALRHERAPKVTQRSVQAQIRMAKSVKRANRAKAKSARRAESTASAQSPAVDDEPSLASSSTDAPAHFSAPAAAQPPAEDEPPLASPSTGALAHSSPPALAVAKCTCKYACACAHIDWLCMDMWSTDVFDVDAANLPPSAWFLSATRTGKITHAPSQFEFNFAIRAVVAEAHTIKLHTKKGPTCDAELEMWLSRSQRRMSLFNKMHKRVRKCLVPTSPVTPLEVVASMKGYMRRMQSLMHAIDAAAVLRRCRTLQQTGADLPLGQAYDANYYRLFGKALKTAPWRLPRNT